MATGTVGGEGGLSLEEAQEAAKWWEGAERSPGDGREIAGRWPGDRREIAGRSPGDRREIRRDVAEVSPRQDLG